MNIEFYLADNREKLDMRSSGTAHARLRSGVPDKWIGQRVHVRPPGHYGAIVNSAQSIILRCD
jgi:hypothetical protein